MSLVPIHFIFLLYIELPEMDLVNDLMPVAAQWRSLGLQLKISFATLDVIENQKSYFAAILCQWISGAGIKCTKENLIKTLRKEAIRENGLATKIEEDNGIMLFVCWFITKYMYLGYIS